MSAITCVIYVKNWNLLAQAYAFTTVLGSNLHHV